MRSAFGFAFAGLLAACSAEQPRRVSPERVEAAVDHSNLELERAIAPAPKRASGTSR